MSEERVTLPIPTGLPVARSANLPEGHTPVINTDYKCALVTTEHTVKMDDQPTGCMYERQKAMRDEIERQSENKCSVSFETPCERCFSLNYGDEPHGECMMASWPASPPPTSDTAEAAPTEDRSGRDPG